MATLPMISAVRRQPIAPKAAAITRRHLRHAMSLVAVGMLIALFYVWVRVQVIQMGYEVSRLRKETTELGQRRDLLEAEVASLKSPERLMRAAAETFGMRMPNGDEVVLVNALPPPQAPAVAEAR